MDELQVILKDLYLVFGLNLSIFDLTGHLVTSYPVSNSPFCHLVKSNSKVLELCKNCDREAFDYVKKMDQSISIAATLACMRPVFLCILMAYIQVFL